MNGARIVANGARSLAPGSRRRPGRAQAWPDRAYFPELLRSFGGVARWPSPPDATLREASTPGRAALLGPELTIAVIATAASSSTATATAAVSSRPGRSLFRARDR